jgi:hypothetical protein
MLLARAVDGSRRIGMPAGPWVAGARDGSTWGPLDRTTPVFRQQTVHDTRSEWFPPEPQGFHLLGAWDAPCS